MSYSSEWEASYLANFYHSFPHNDFANNPVSKLYNIHKYQYREALFMAGSIHLIWLNIAVITMFIMVLIRWFLQDDSEPAAVCKCDMCWPRLFIYISILAIAFCFIFEWLIHAIIMCNMNVDKKLTQEYPYVFPNYKKDLFPYLQSFFDEESDVIYHIYDIAKYYNSRLNGSTKAHEIYPKQKELWLKVFELQMNIFNKTNFTFKDPDESKEDHPLHYLYNEVKPWRRFLYFMFVWCFLLFLLIMSLCMIDYNELFWVPLFLTMVMLCVAAVSVTVEAVALGDACQDLSHTSDFLENTIKIPANENHCQVWVREVTKNVTTILEEYNQFIHDKIVDLYPHLRYYGSREHLMNLKKMLPTMCALAVKETMHRIVRMQDFEDLCPEPTRKIDYDTEGTVRSFCEYDCILMPFTIQIVLVLIAATLIIRCLFTYIQTRQCVIPRDEECSERKHLKQRLKYWVHSKRYAVLRSLYQEPPLTTLRRAFWKCYGRSTNCLCKNCRKVKRFEKKVRVFVTRNISNVKRERRSRRSKRGAKKKKPRSHDESFDGVSETWDETTPHTRSSNDERCKICSDIDNDPQAPPDDYPEPYEPKYDPEDTCSCPPTDPDYPEDPEGQCEHIEDVSTRRRHKRRSKAHRPMPTFYEDEARTSAVYATPSHASSSPDNILIRQQQSIVSHHHVQDPIGRGPAVPRSVLKQRTPDAHYKREPLPSSRKRRSQLLVNSMSRQNLDTEPNVDGSAEIDASKALSYTEDRDAQKRQHEEKPRHRDHDKKEDLDKTEQSHISHKHKSRKRHEEESFKGHRRKFKERYDETNDDDGDSVDDEEFYFPGAMDRDLDDGTVASGKGSQEQSHHRKFEECQPREGTFIAETPSLYHASVHSTPAGSIVRTMKKSWLRRKRTKHIEGEEKKKPSSSKSRPSSRQSNPATPTLSTSPRTPTKPKKKTKRRSIFLKGSSRTSPIARPDKE